MKEKLKALWAAFLVQLESAWSKISGVLYVIITLAGVLFLVAKYRDLLMDWIVGGAKRDFNSAQKKDEALKQKEDQAKSQANTLVQQAEDLQSGKAPVSDDWYKSND